jgi:hypothetical protein
VHKFLVRASAMKQFLTKGRGKGEEFGQTALTYIKECAIADYFERRKAITAKEMDKGITLENEAIQVLNTLEFKNYVKNTVRMTNNGFTGECDIDSKEESLIRDIKCAWSIGTFSWFAEDLLSKCADSGYEAQVRTYMMLYERDYARVDEVLLSTPFELIPSYEDEEYHDVDFIPLIKRHTSVLFERDKEWEEQVMERYLKAEKIYNQFIINLDNKR